MAEHHISSEKKLLLCLTIFILILASCDLSSDPEHLPPIVQILSPADSSFFTESDKITFRGSVGGGNGAGGGNLKDGTFLWESSIDGELGTEKEITASLSPGEHRITFTATDAANIPASISISVFVYSDINLRIVEPENNSLHFAGDAISCKVEVEPEEYVDNIIWKLDGDVIDCSDGEFSVNERGKYALSAEIQKDGGIVWKTSVGFEVLPIVRGTVYAVPEGNVPGTVSIGFGDEIDSGKVGADGIFEIRTKLITKSLVEVRFEPDNGNEHYQSYATLLGSEVAELADNGGFNLIAIPRKWKIKSGYHTGEVVEIRLEHAFDKAGGSNEVDRFYQFHRLRGGLMSALEKDLPLRTYFDRINIDVEITPEDSVNFWETIDSLHIYLGMGKLFVPANAGEGDDTRRFVRIRTDSTENPGATRSFAEGDNNVTGGTVQFGRPGVFTENRATVYHEMIHFLGPGHTCFWPTNMRRGGCPPWTPSGSSPGAHYSGIPTSYDVAYIQLLYATRQMQYDLSIPFGIEEAWEAIK